MCQGRPHAAAVGREDALGRARAGLDRAARGAGRLLLHGGARRRAGLYLWAELEVLLAETPQLRLVGSVLEPLGSEGPDNCQDRAARCRIQVGSLDATLLAEREVWAEQRVYLCGYEDLVRKLQKKLYLAGVPLARIHADPFVAPGARADRRPLLVDGCSQLQSLLGQLLRLPLKPGALLGRRPRLTSGSRMGSAVRHAMLPQDGPIVASLAVARLRHEPWETRGQFIVAQ